MNAQDDQFGFLRAWQAARDNGQNGQYAALKYLVEVPQPGSAGFSRGALYQVWILGCALFLTKEEIEAIQNELWPDTFKDDEFYRLVNGFWISKFQSGPLLCLNNGENAWRSMQYEALKDFQKLEPENFKACCRLLLELTEEGSAAIPALYGNRVRNGRQQDLDLETQVHRAFYLAPLDATESMRLFRDALTRPNIQRGVFEHWVSGLILRQQEFLDGEDLSDIWDIWKQVAQPAMQEHYDRPAPKA
jgi:hypothetical protein